MDALANTEGGRGRLAYLKLRQRMNPQDRYHNRIRTSSQHYGWNLNPPSAEANGGMSRTQSAMSYTASSPTRLSQQSGADELTAALEREKRIQLGHDSRALGLGLKFSGDTNKNPHGDFRRKDSLKALSRSSGVFPSGS